ncbi:UPF0481 protein At3g47200 [Populus alba]|uniref:UPF0481 protein At3g47200 n=1 Tax=Populus alba TaxID=43335 RepID=UPI00158C7BA0|nr:UPF0481 protein At3g47200-like [Populus alba]
MSRCDPLIVKINEKLTAPINHSTCSIFKVPSRLRHVNEKAFEPEILSIGPYHRGKDSLKMMEEHKERYLEKLLKRRGESSVERYVEAMIVLVIVISGTTPPPNKVATTTKQVTASLVPLMVACFKGVLSPTLHHRSPDSAQQIGVEEEARKFYDQSEVSLGQDEFVEMLLLDGCFIVELIRKCNNTRGVSGEADPVFEVPWILPCIETDTMLLENQLPFFVLLKLFTMTSGQSEKDFFGMALNFCQQIFRGLGNHIIHENECKHLLVMLYHAGYQPPDSTESPNGNDWNFIRNAKELQEAGIKLKKREGSWRLFDVVFSENGTIEIPCLKVDDRTESLFRNLVAYEQCSQRQHPYVTDYITLMDCLINTQEDVQILRHSGIIENGLGDDETVCSLFNKLGINVTFSHRRLFYFCYNKVFDGVKEHCNRKRNVWMAKLKRDYFNSPWALLSFLAAVALLLFTLVQTVLTVMSYFQKD